MRTFTLSLAVLLSALACTASTPEPSSQLASGDSRGSLDSREHGEPRAVDVAPVVLELPDDPYGGVLPLGAFESVEALCAKQKEMILPRIVDAQEEFDERGMEVAVEPWCVEAPEALRSARVSLGGPFADVTAISLEAGYGLATFLVVRTAEGWTAVRDEILSEGHDDPGCPSIEREKGVLEVRVERDALVVVTTADRAWYGGQHGGVLALTHARACRVGDWAPTCSRAATIAATITVGEDDEADAPPVVEEVFSTTFRVDADGAIEVAEDFDEASL